MFEGYEDVVYCVNCGVRTGDRFNCPFCKKTYFCARCLGRCRCEGITKDLRYIISCMEECLVWNLIVRGYTIRGLS